VGVPLTDGNRVEVLRNGDETFPALAGAVGRAERSIDMLWFSWGRGPVAEDLGAALADRARHGVRVRVLLDAFGSSRIARPLLADLRRAGCDVRFYRPLLTWRPTTPNLRTHRRVLVVDDGIAFTGGACIDQSWTGDGHAPHRWRDTNVRLRGPAVDGIRSGFVAAWAQTGAGPPGAAGLDEGTPPGQPAVGGTAAQVLRPSSAPGWNDAALAIAALLRLARRQVRVASPYARLPDWLRDLVVATSSRGVRVQLLVSGPHVDRPAVHLQAEHHYQPLLEAGVEIWRYQPARMHTKVITVDGTVAMLGTTNFDLRSLDLNEQIALLLVDPDVVSVLDDHFDDDLASSTRVELDDWRSRGLARRILETVSARALLPVGGWGTTGLIGLRPR
jgi:cardiolipin synthase